MTAALKWDLISVQDYLAGERNSPVKHEYIGGVVYAMAGARVVHNDITSNTLIAAGTRLRGKGCRPYTSDMKIRIRYSDHTRFYYPDISVVCRSNPATDAFQDEPAVIFEVLSKKTRRIDLGEKKDAYLTIPSLGVYVVIEQESPTVVAFRRTETGLVREVYEGLDAVLPLDELKIELPLSEIYEGVTFAPEAGDEDDGFTQSGVDDDASE